MKIKELFATAKRSIKGLYMSLFGDKPEQYKKDLKMFPENTDSAYRFCFGTPTKNGGYKKEWYDFEPEQISDFLSKLIEKEDKREKFGNKKGEIEYKTVCQMVAPVCGGIYDFKWNGKKFRYLYRYMNIQNLRNMFAIMAYRKIPLNIFGKSYFVKYDNGVDFKEFATDEQFIDQACYKKELNSGKVRVCKDFLTFKMT